MYGGPTHYVCRPRHRLPPPRGYGDNTKNTPPPYVAGPLRPTTTNRQEEQETYKKTYISWAQSQNKKNENQKKKWSSNRVAPMTGFGLLTEHNHTYTKWTHMHFKYMKAKSIS